MQINYKNKIYEVEIIKKNNKNTYIRIKDNKVVITTSRFVTKKYIDKLIISNYDNIYKMIDNYHKNNNNNFMLFGKEYIINYIDTENIIVNNNNIYVKNDIMLNKWLDNIVKKSFGLRVKYLRNKYYENIPPFNVKIRSMSSRWGVCNRRFNYITLNYNLYKYSIDCLDYVIIHELSHFVHPNHSKYFWQTVAKYIPNYKEIRKKLR